jgi:hypothetical protein
MSSHFLRNVLSESVWQAFACTILFFIFASVPLLTGVTTWYGYIAVFIVCFLCYLLCYFGAEFGKKLISNPYFGGFLGGIVGIVLNLILLTGLFFFVVSRLS